MWQGGRKQEGNMVVKVARRWRNRGGQSDSYLPQGHARAGPRRPDSQPNRYAVRWFKVIITLADGWCLSSGCWNVMNETLVNTTKNMIRDHPPPTHTHRWQQAIRIGGKKMSLQMCLRHHRLPQTQTHTQSSSTALYPVHFFYSSSVLLNKRWKKTGDLRRQICICVSLCAPLWEYDFCPLGLLPRDQMICVQQGVPPADMHKPHKVDDETKLWKCKVKRDKVSLK